MPLYTVSTKDPLSDAERSGIAMMITDVHCGHTDAPRTFVQTLFSQNVPLKQGVSLHIYASVRAGRTHETNELIKRDMIQQAAHITGFVEDGIEFALFEVPASWVMEGGVVLPEPGEEEAWLKEHNRAG